MIAPIWPPSTTLDINVYVSHSFVMPALSNVPTDRLVLEEKEFKIGDWDDKREISTSFEVPKEVQNNGTLWAHFYVAKSGSVMDPKDKSYDSHTAYHFTRPLNQFLAKKKVAKTKKLLGGDASDRSSDPVENEVVSQGRIISSYYHPNVTLSLIPDSGVMNYPKTHPAVMQFIQLERTRARDETGQNGWYYPIMFVNTFWQLRDHMTELNSTVKTLPLHISLNNLNNWKFSIISSIDEGMKQNQRQVANGGSLPAGGDGTEFEMFKGILLDTNIYLLATTGIVSILHMIFEMLAFKNDIVSLHLSPNTFLSALTTTVYGSHIGRTRKITSASPSGRSSPTSSCNSSSSCTWSTTPTAHRT